MVEGPDRMAHYNKAKDFAKQGDKAVKKGMFKKPDYDGAILLFIKAGKEYELANYYNEAFVVYKKLAECNKKVEDLYAVASAMEHMAINHYKVHSDKEYAISIMQEASSYFKIHGAANKSLKVMQKFAKEFTEGGAVELGIEVYASLFAEVFEGDNYLYSNDIITEYLNSLISTDQFSQAIKAYTVHIKYLRKQGKFEHPKLRAWLSIVCLHLCSREPHIAQDKIADFASDVGGNGRSDEFELANKLLDAYEERDGAAWKKLLRHPLFGHIDIEVGRKLRKIIVEPEALPEVPVPVGAILDPPGEEPVDFEGENEDLTKEEEKEDFGGAFA